MGKQFGAITESLNFSQTISVYGYPCCWQSFLSNKSDQRFLTLSVILDLLRWRLPSFIAGHMNADQCAYLSFRKDLMVFLFVYRSDVPVRYEARFFLGHGISKQMKSRNYFYFYCNIALFFSWQVLVPHKTTLTFSPFENSDAAQQ